MTAKTKRREPAPLADSDPFWGVPESPEFSRVERLMNEFGSHEALEREFVSLYKDTASKTSNPLVKFLLELIIADEEKHHGVIAAMVSSLKNELAWTRQEESLRLYRPDTESPGLVEITERFLRHEREAINAFERLKKVSGGYYDDVFVLLFETMIHDSHKHIAMLEFLRRRLKES